LSGLFYGLNDLLNVGVVAPHWQLGWQTITRDEFLADVIETFFHFARQYIVRSRIVGLIGAIVLTYGRACDFRGDWAQDIFARNKDPHKSIWAMIPQDVGLMRDEYRSRHKIFCPKNGKSREFLAWAHIINGLDPFIHRAIYQYWKASALYWGFCEEAVTALDGVTSIAGEFLQQRFGVQGNPRQSLMTTLQLSTEDQKLIDHLYNLRCDFGAHPSRSKWWDFAEIYDEDIDALRDSVRRMLWRLCQIENLNPRSRGLAALTAFVR
jgi:hypothetical protein